ncbi:MAG: hypothetical protein AB7G06_09185 [Bdellovibrionales bacterium]
MAVFEVTAAELFAAYTGIFTQDGLEEGRIFDLRRMAAILDGNWADEQGRIHQGKYGADDGKPGWVAALARTRARIRAACNNEEVGLFLDAYDCVADDLPMQGAVVDQRTISEVSSIVAYLGEKYSQIQLRF